MMCLQAKTTQCERRFCLHITVGSPCVYTSVCSVSAVGSLWKADFLFSAHHTQSPQASCACHSSTTLFILLTLCFIKPLRTVLLYKSHRYCNCVWVDRLACGMVLIAFWDSRSDITGLIPYRRMCELERY